MIVIGEHDFEMTTSRNEKTLVNRRLQTNALGTWMDVALGVPELIAQHLRYVVVLPVEVKTVDTLLRTNKQMERPLAVDNLHFILTLTGHSDGPKTIN